MGLLAPVVHWWHFGRPFYVGMKRISPHVPDSKLLCTACHLNHKMLETVLRIKAALSPSVGCAILEVIGHPRKALAVSFLVSLPLIPHLPFSMLILDQLCSAR